MKDNKALIILSGGQDSTTCLFWAQQYYKEVEAITFLYGQRHGVEIECAKKIAQIAKVKWTLLTTTIFEQLGDSALIDKKLEIKTIDKSFPNTFIPGRNLFFLLVAGMYAYQYKIHHLVIGASQVDFSNYPDCRSNVIQTMALAMRLGMDYEIDIHTPLMMSKKDIVLLGEELGITEYMKYTHTCYEGKRPPCGKCPACILRAKGFNEAGVKDPLLEE